ncbi:twitchin-like, partial [Limulus polyphemus]|uniref:Twitchin-like n=1 Tax=Limulus polyphemus TaxID=6850 RepID=A0ABM1C462_LIMPO
VVKHYTRVAAEETRYVMSGLKKGHMFLFRVSAENAAGVGRALINKTPVRIRSIRMKPSPPGKPVVEFNNEAGDSVHLSWSPPELSGSAPIRTYIVERFDLLSDIWVRINREEFTSPCFTATDLQPGLEYTFRVSAENEVGISKPGTSSEPVIIRTKRVASPPVFTLELEDVNVVAQDDVTFYCEFSGSPTPEITWYKGGIEVFDSSRVTINIDNKCSSLILRSVKVTDSGRIECQALSLSGLATTCAKLSVDAPPKIVMPSRYLNGMFFDCGDTLCVKVSINGSPTPEIAWWRNGRKLHEDPRIEILVDGDRGILKIHNLEPNDRGDYVVVVSNELGSSSQSFQVTVTDKPDPPEGRPVVSDVDWKSCVLSWQPPKHDGGSPITKYVIEKRAVSV